MSGRIGPNYRNVVISDGLFIYFDAYRFDSYPRTGDIWYDLTANSNHSTLYNGPLFNYGNVGRILFDGVNDYGESGAGSIGSDSSDYSWQIWIKPNTISTSYFISRGQDYSGSGWSLLTGIYGITQKYWVGVVINEPQPPPANYGYSGHDVFSTTDASTSNWVNITGVYKKDTDIKIYINGILEGTTALPSSYTLRPSTKGWLLAAYPGGNYYSQLGNGYYGQILVYNRELNASEVLENFNGTKDRFEL